MSKTATMKDLLEAGAHFGHQTRRWNPKMDRFIFGAKSGVHIIDLEKTEAALEAAAEFAKETVSSGANIIFLATKRQAQENEAERVGAMYMVERWLGGLFTNFDSVRKTIDKMPLLEEKLKEVAGYTKKEQLMTKRELAKLTRYAGGIRGLDKLPGAIFVVDAKKEDNAVREANKMGIKVIAIVDTNADPTKVDYPIPANDDALKSIALIVKVLADAVAEGKALWEKKAANEEAKKNPPAGGKE
jgi:small subunit ribosomal protein S2